MQHVRAGQEVFGLTPQELLGQSVTYCIDIFRKPVAGDTSCPWSAPVLLIVAHLYLTRVLALSSVCRGHQPAICLCPAFRAAAAWPCLSTSNQTISQGAQASLLHIEGEPTYSICHTAAQPTTLLPCSAAAYMMHIHDIVWIVCLCRALGWTLSAAALSFMRRSCLQASLRLTEVCLGVAS